VVVFGGTVEVIIFGGVDLVVVFVIFVGRVVVIFGGRVEYVDSSSVIVCGTFGGSDGGKDLVVIVGGYNDFVVPVNGVFEVIGVDGVVFNDVVTTVFGGFLAVVLVDGAVLVA